MEKINIRAIIRETILKTLLEDATSDDGASEEAHRLGLTHKGYGYWADASGKAVARTVKGKLVKMSDEEQAKQNDPAQANPYSHDERPAGPKHVPGPNPGAKGDPYENPDKEYPGTQHVTTYPVPAAMVGKANPPTKKDGSPLTGIHNGQTVYVDAINKENKSFTVTNEKGETYEIPANEITPANIAHLDGANKLTNLKSPKTIARMILDSFDWDLEKAEQWVASRREKYPENAEAIDQLLPVLPKVKANEKEYKREDAQRRSWEKTAARTRAYRSQHPIDKNSPEYLRDHPKKPKKESVELTETTAGEQAKQLGLHHIGWGRYANEEGKVVAKSVNGQLVKLEPGQEEEIPDEDHGIFDKQTLKHLKKIFASAGEWTPQSQDTGATHISPGWNKTHKDIAFDANGEETVKKLLAMVRDPKKLLLWLLKKFKEETPNGKKRILQYVGILDKMGVLDSGDAQAVASGKNPDEAKPKAGPEAPAAEAPREAPKVKGNFARKKDKYGI